MSGALAENGGEGKRELTLPPRGLNLASGVFAGSGIRCKPGTVAPL